MGIATVSAGFGLDNRRVMVAINSDEYFITLRLRSSRQRDGHCHVNGVEGKSNGQAYDQYSSNSFSGVHASHPTTD